MHLLQLVNESDCKHTGAGAITLSGGYITLSHCLLHTKTKEHKQKLVESPKLLTTADTWNAFQRLTGI